MIRHALCAITKYPIPFVRPSLDWLAKPSQASQSREGLRSGIGYFCEARRQAQGLTTGCGTGYIQFVTGPADRPARGGDGGHPCLH